jgi:hypothetical protein
MNGWLFLKHIILFLFQFASRKQYIFYILFLCIFHLKMVIRIRKSKDRQHNGQKKGDKSTNNNLQNTTQKTE